MCQYKTFTFVTLFFTFDTFTFTFYNVGNIFCLINGENKWHRKLHYKI